MSKNPMKSFMAGLLCILLLAILGCSQSEERRPAWKSGEKDQPALFTENEREYVGSEKCKECHWREYDSWKHTLHSKFMQLPDEFTVMGDFEVDNKLIVNVTDKAPTQTSTDTNTSMSVVADKLVVNVSSQLPSRPLGKEIKTTMRKEGKKYYVNTIGSDWKFHDYEVTAVIGINRKQNYLTKFPNGELHVLPIEWDLEGQKWNDYFGLETHFPGDGSFWSDQGRIWQYKCGSCHATGLKIDYDKTTDSYATTMVDMGIGCEACHGPGSQHVQAASTYYDYEKDTIVNPAKLPWRLRAMVCGQCHNWGASTAKVEPAKEGFPQNYAYSYGYKVGQPLYLFYDETAETEEIHHQQYNEWLDSPHAEAGVMCTTCHSVHAEGGHKTQHKSQTKLAADNLCTSCHSSLQKKAAHRIHTFGSCISCHMPKTAGHEHRHSFKFISPEESLQAGGVDKLMNSCSGCHHHKNSSLFELIEFLDAAKKQDMPKPFSAHSKER